MVAYSKSKATNGVDKDKTEPGCVETRSVIKTAEDYDGADPMHLPGQAIWQNRPFVAHMASLH